MIRFLFHTFVWGSLHIFNYISHKFSIKASISLNARMENIYIKKYMFKNDLLVGNYRIRQKILTKLYSDGPNDRFHLRFLRYLLQRLYHYSPVPGVQTYMVEYSDSQESRQHQSTCRSWRLDNVTAKSFPEFPTLNTTADRSRTPMTSRDHVTSYLISERSVKLGSRLKS